MGVRYPGARRVKIHRNYTVEELAKLLGVHKNTVRRWERSGLRPTDDHRPKLFRGPEVHRFIREEQQKAKRPTPPGQMYCFGCRAPREPFGRLIDLLPRTANLANLRGLCECGTMMHRTVSHRTIQAAMRGLTAAIPQAPSRLRDTPYPTVDGHLAETWSQYAKSPPTQ